MEAPIVLSLCDYSGNMVEPWAKVGYECWCVDIQHPQGVGELERGVRKVGADVTRFCPPLNRCYAIVFAFPPCTHLAVSGALHFQDKGMDALADSLHIVQACVRICEASGCPYMLENPVSMLSSYWRTPDQTFNPCDYAGYLEYPLAEAYTKKTCLWLGNGFRMPQPKKVKPELGSKMHRLSPGVGRAQERSMTPRGFAKAVFEANYPRMTQEGLVVPEEYQQGRSLFSS